MKPVYLDNNATTRVDPEVVSAMLPYLTEHFGNPSSAHGFAAPSRQGMKTARDNVAALVGTGFADEILFTSGGTESDNTALITGLAAHPGRDEVVVSAVEHPAVLALVKRLEAAGRLKAHVIPVLSCGCLDRERYRAALSPRVAVVSMMWANNETGILFPVEALAEEAKAVGALFHTDAVQAAGREPIDVKRTAIDLMSLSAHKLHGPKGVGALYVRRGVKLEPIVHGGRQERARRGGTENVPGVVGFGKAAKIAGPRLRGDTARMRALRDRLESGLLGRIRNAMVLGASAERLPNTSAIVCADAEAEAVATMLGREGIAVSTGAACSAGSHEPSHVLKAIGTPVAAEFGAVRFSLSRETDDDDIDRALTAMAEIVARLRDRAPCTAEGRSSRPREAAYA
ncbi:aminotransferase class V-fold PLP-dependent enzyme [Roseiarcus sp.]|uniref:aminotransferase class V-fold PLP-dependent enzyme n=1 Tax=Roseiarcus sp. TaxID=1969460 RepID=UPI003F9ACBC7